MDIHLVKVDGGFRPCSGEDYDKMRRFKAGEVVRATVVKPRNWRFHRKFFAMLRCAWDCLTEQQRQNLHSEDGFRQYLLIASGFTDVTYDIRGRQYAERAKSISFAKMDETEFDTVYNRVLDGVLVLLSNNGIGEDAFNEILREYGT